MSMESPVSIGVVAPSSAVGQVELSNGVARLREAGFTVHLHPQCAQQHFTFAGRDEARRDALLEYAYDPSIDVIWCARGGYGATRLLPLLDTAAETRGRPPKKLLVGYSDITVLHEYVRRNWGWSTLHAAMPAASNFSTMQELEATVDFVRRRSAPPSWLDQSLQWLTAPPAQAITGPLIGGNLTLWACLAGTAYAPSPAGGILFFEDLGEAYYRLDRMMTQMVQAGMIEGAAAIVLGDFLDCRDEANEVLASASGPDKKPLRPVYGEAEAFDEIFGTVARRHGIPVARGVPVGHGPHFSPLPLGAQYELRPDGALRLIDWNWLNK